MKQVKEGMKEKKVINKQCSVAKVSTGKSSQTGKMTGLVGS